MKIENLYLGLSLALFSLMALFKGDKNLSERILNELPINDITLLSVHDTHAIDAIGWSIKRGLALTARLFLSGTAFYWTYVIALFFISFVSYYLRRSKNYNYLFKRQFFKFL